MSICDVMRSLSVMQSRIDGRAIAVALALVVSGNFAFAQSYGAPAQGQPGDRMIQHYLQNRAQQVHGRFLDGVTSLADWQERREQYKQECLYMLGLWPLPEKTPLKATVTGTLKGDGYAVDMLHYQSRPQLYVTANLYRPENVAPGERLPAILYACGHSRRQGRNGAKAAYQSHGIWFARHGYICLIVDTVEIGEIASTHLGTYKENRWWWHSRGYTPAGVECFNGIRAIDYLVGRDDVDPERIGMTGISGGGAVTLWVAMADERVKVAAPVSGMADLPSYVPNRTINGHCDCIFMHNAYGWPWTRIPALVAPRPLLFVNSDQDRILPMDANNRIISRLKEVYRLYGATNFVDAHVSSGRHTYRQDIRKAVYRFMNLHLKDDPREVNDSEVDLVLGDQYPIAPKRLRVFPEDSEIPKDHVNTTIDRRFVPLAEVAVPSKGEFAGWKKRILEQLRQVTFRNLPEAFPLAKPIEVSRTKTRLQTEPGIQIELRFSSDHGQSDESKRILLIIGNGESKQLVPDWASDVQQEGDCVYECIPRGYGVTRWTRGAPHYVARSHALLGQTEDTGRVWDVAATAAYLKKKHGGSVPVYVAGKGRLGAIGAYAGLLSKDIDGVVLEDPPNSHMDADAPQLLNVLRVCDVSEVLGMLAPKPLSTNADVSCVDKIYEAAGASESIVHRSSISRSE